MKRPAAMAKQSLLMDRLGRLGYNKKLALYKTAYYTQGEYYVSIDECVIYEDRYGGKTPVLRCKSDDYILWFRPEELTNFVL